MLVRPDFYKPKLSAVNTPTGFFVAGSTFMPQFFKGFLKTQK
jgi:hypothetical protein